MHREVDGAAEQGLLDLLGKETLAARLRQGAVLDHVAGGADDRERNARLLDPLGGGEARPHHVGLRQRERAAARADPQQAGGGG